MTSPELPLTARPTRDEIRKAAWTLMHAWHPGLLLSGDPGYAEARADGEEYDPFGGCDCAGTDEYGESRGCNCGDGCSCDSCSHYAHLRHKTCQAGAVSIGTRCTRETSYRVVAYRMQHDHLSGPRGEGQACPHEGGQQQDACHCTERSVFYESGLHPVTYWTRSACSVPCAQQIIAGAHAARGDNGPQYYIERWSYEPHDLDLPEQLARLRTHTRMARDRTGYLVNALAQGRDAGIELRLQAARESVALAAWSAVAPLNPREGDEDVWADEVRWPVQEEPSEPDGPE
ncbi:hypothetical protein [Streptomyces prunicolor]|uniref:hypothetical protein n=1 Tax=Streptomyces prunicolor TaxID=67348 RepID=UPI0033E875B2